MFEPVKWNERAPVKFYTAVKSPVKSTLFEFMGEYKTIGNLSPRKILLCDNCHMMSHDDGGGQPAGNHQSSRPSWLGSGTPPAGAWSDMDPSQEATSARGFSRG